MPTAMLGKTGDASGYGQWEGAGRHVKKVLVGHGPGTIFDPVLDHLHKDLPVARDVKHGPVVFVAGGAPVVYADHRRVLPKRPPPRTSGGAAAGKGAVPAAGLQGGSLGCRAHVRPAGLALMGPTPTLYAALAFAVSCGNFAAVGAIRAGGAVDPPYPPEQLGCGICIGKPYNGDSSGPGPFLSPCFWVVLDAVCGAAAVWGPGGSTPVDILRLIYTVKAKFAVPNIRQKSDVR